MAVDLCMTYYAHPHVDDHDLQVTLGRQRQNISVELSRQLTKQAVSIELAVVGHFLRDLDFENVYNYGLTILGFPPGLFALDHCETYFWVMFGASGKFK